MTLQDKVFAKIKSSATLSLGRIEHTNFSGCLEIRFSFIQEAMMGENPADLHDEPALTGYHNLDRNFVAILIFCFRHIEDGEDRRDNDEDCSIDEVTSWTDPLSNAKHQRECWILADSSVFAEKTLRLEFFRVWVRFWVVQDRPETSSGRYTGS